MEPLRAPAAAASTDECPLAPSAWMALGVLFLVYLLNFLDRTLIYILFTPIKAELKFSDTELALLGTTSFVLFYTVLGVPFGRLADRVSRKKLIAAGLATWSLFSGLTGFADSFATLFLCRVMVGVGEATLGPAAMSLLADLFPARRHGMVQSLYSAGIPLGAAAAFFLGGQIAAAWGWRAAFFTLGFPGLLLAVAVLFLPERARPTTQAATTEMPASSTVTDLRTLWNLPVLRWHVLGYATFAIASNALSIWVPKLVVGASLTAQLGAAPETFALATTDATRTYTLVLDGAQDAVLDVVARTPAGTYVVVDERPLKGSSYTLEVPATYAHPVWVTAHVTGPSVPVAQRAFAPLQRLSPDVDGGAIRLDLTAAASPPDVGQVVTAPHPTASLAAMTAAALKGFGNFSGLSMAIAGGLATAVGGALADRWRARAAGGRLRFGALLAALCVVPWIAIALSTETLALQGAFFVLAGIGLAWLGGAAADVHAIAPPALRGLGIASYYLVVNLVGYGVAPLVVGTISDVSDLRTALLVCPAACLAAAALLWRASRMQDVAA